MIVFKSREARRRANIIAATLSDLGMAEIRQLASGRVQARLKDTLYLFDWDHRHQTVQCIYTQEYVEVSPMRSSHDSFPVTAEQHSAGLGFRHTPFGRELTDRVEGYDQDESVIPAQYEPVDQPRGRPSRREGDGRRVDQARAERRMLDPVRLFR